MIVNILSGYYYPTLTLNSQLSGSLYLTINSTFLVPAIGVPRTLNVIKFGHKDTAEMISTDYKGRVPRQPHHTTTPQLTPDAKGLKSGEWSTVTSQSTLHPLSSVR